MCTYLWICLFLFCPSVVVFFSVDDLVFVKVEFTGDIFVVTECRHTHHDDCFYIALFSALEQTHCARMWFYVHYSILPSVYRETATGMNWWKCKKMHPSFVCTFKGPAVLCWGSGRGLLAVVRHACTRFLLVVTTVWMWMVSWLVRVHFSSFQWCFTSSEPKRTVRDGEPRTATSTLTQSLSSDFWEICETSFWPLAFSLKTQVSVSSG